MVLSSVRAAQGSGSSSFPGVGAGVDDLPLLLSEHIEAAVFQPQRYDAFGPAPHFIPILGGAPCPECAYDRYDRDPDRPVTLMPRYRHPTTASPSMVNDRAKFILVARFTDGASPDNS
jgi:hypothetical protein